MRFDELHLYFPICLVALSKQILIGSGTGYSSAIALFFAVDDCSIMLSAATAAALM